MKSNIIAEGGSAAPRELTFGSIPASVCHNHSDAGGNFDVMHWHSEVQLSVVTSGRVRFLTRDCEYVLEKGQGIFLNSNRIHMAQKDTEETDCSYLCIRFDPEELCGSLCDSYAVPLIAAASELLGYGAQVQKLNFDLFRQVSKARIFLEGLICSGLRFYADGKVVAATVTEKMMQEAVATENDCDDIAGIPGRVEGCVLSLVIRELAPGRCKVSARSQPSFDCSALCARFGGGGHKMASGCTVDASPDETREMLVSAALEVL